VRRLSIVLAVLTVISGGLLTAVAAAESDDVRYGDISPVEEEVRDTDPIDRPVSGEQGAPGTETSDDRPADAELAEPTRGPGAGVGAQAGSEETGVRGVMLARTGLDGAGGLALVAALVLAGTGLIWLARRRATASR
jgi:hypothetical protein